MDEKKEKNWFRKHLVLTIVLGVPIGIILIGIFWGIISNIGEGNNITGDVISDNIENINEQVQKESCVPDWQCSSWSECSKSGIQTRVCTDSNDCNVLTNKPDESQFCTYELSFITKSPDEMLPTPPELPTEYSIGEKEDITKESPVITSTNAQEGFDSGKRFDISKYKVGMGGYTITDYIEITFGIYKFDDSNYASDFQSTIVNEIKNEGGYSELSVSSDAECFAWKQDYGYSGGRIGSSICHNANVIYWIDVSMVNTFKNPDGILKDMVKIIDKRVR